MYDFILKGAREGYFLDFTRKGYSTNFVFAEALMIFDLSKEIYLQITSETNKIKIKI